MVPVSVGAALLYAVIVWQLGRLDGSEALRSATRGAAMVAVVPLLFMLIGGWSAAGLAIGLIYAVQFAPATVAALRTDDVGGVATATWAMAFGEAVIWLFYGWSESDVALTVGGAGGALMSGVILWRVASLSQRQLPVLEPSLALDVVTGPVASGPRAR